MRALADDRREAAYRPDRRLSELITGFWSLTLTCREVRWGSGPDALADGLVWADQDDGLGG